MNALKAYAEQQIAELGLCDTPTNCHGVVAQDAGGAGGAGVRLTDGIGLDVFCRSAREVDRELAVMAAWYAESES